MQQLTYINLRGERAVFGRGAPYLLRSVRGVGACDNALTLTEDGRARRGAASVAAARGAGDHRGPSRFWGRRGRGFTKAARRCAACSRPIWRRTARAARASCTKTTTVRGGPGRCRWAGWTGRRAPGDVHTGVNVRGFSAKARFSTAARPREAVGFARHSGGFRLPGRAAGQAWVAGVSDARDQRGLRVRAVRGSRLRAAARRPRWSTAPPAPRCA